MLRQLILPRTSIPTALDNLAAECFGASLVSSSMAIEVGLAGERETALDAGGALGSQVDGRSDLGVEAGCWG